MRIDRASRSLGEALDIGENVEGAVAALVDGFLDGRLEVAARVDDEPGGVDVRPIACGQVEVVRLGAGRRQVDDLRAAGHDLPGRERERVEGGDHAALVGRRVAATREDPSRTTHKRTILESTRARG